MAKDVQVCYLNISFRGIITTVGKERADFSAIDHSLFEPRCEKTGFRGF